MNISRISMCRIYFGSLEIDANLLPFKFKQDLMHVRGIKEVGE